MKVKNGIASRSSLERTLPNTRPGIACRKFRSKKPRWMARNPNDSPTAASVNATGKPISIARTRPPNIIGGIISSVIIASVSRTSHRS